MSNCTVKNVFRIVSGKPENGTVKWPMRIGEATQLEGHDYYILKFNLHPEQRFYMRKDEARQGGYTVFSDIEVDGESPKFQRPCGFGRLTPDLKTFLPLKFPFPGIRVFMDLIPLGTGE